MDIRDLLLALTLAAVVASLVTGLISFASADKTTQAKTQFYMRLRVAFQAAAIALLALLVYVSR